MKQFLRLFKGAPRRTLSELAAEFEPLSRFSQSSDAKNPYSIGFAKSLSAAVGVGVRSTTLNEMYKKRVGDFTKEQYADLASFLAWRVIREMERGNRGPDADRYRELYRRFGEIADTMYPRSLRVVEAAQKVSAAENPSDDSPRDSVRWGYARSGAIDTCLGLPESRDPIRHLSGNVLLIGVETVMGRVLNEQMGLNRPRV